MSCGVAGLMPSAAIGWRGPAVLDQNSAIQIALRDELGPSNDASALWDVLWLTMVAPAPSLWPQRPMFSIHV